MTGGPVGSLGAAARVLEVLEELGVAYHVGGSYASSVHGTPRQTLDIDLVADLGRLHVAPFIQRLENEFYVDGETVERAIRRRSSFNLVHLASGLKVDVFLPGDSPFDASEAVRRQLLPVGPESRPVYVKSPEDTLLRKLLWYREGGGVSDRQWGDLLGIVRVQGGRLDREYLGEWADRLDLRSLLDRLLSES
jgi:hypothetical protein